MIATKPLSVVLISPSLYRPQAEIGTTGETVEPVPEHVENLPEGLDAE